MKPMKRPYKKYYCKCCKVIVLEQNWNRHISSIKHHKQFNGQDLIEDMQLFNRLNKEIKLWEGRRRMYV